MKLTPKAPTEEGYYWWTNLCEHTPTIMRVSKYQGKMWASNGEYDFEIEGEPEQPELPMEIEPDEDDCMEFNGKKYKMGDDLWSERIPWPVLNGEVIEGEY